MSVREMRQLLGLGKTDSYWLLHKNLFEVILINEKRRIVISSFEKWYTNQVKYHKVNGPPPGEELCKRSYSVPDAAEILKVKPETIYTLIRQGKLKTETTDFCMRIPKEEFERWYRSQSRYRTAADRERDREIEAQTISIPEMAKLLGIPRKNVYGILDCKKYRDCFVIERVADRPRITKKSFKAWLKSQSTYQLQKPKKETHEEPPLKLQCPKNGKYYSFQEIQAFYGISRPTLDSWVLKEGIPTMKLGRVKRIQKDAFDEVLKSKRKVEEDVLKQLIEENDLPKVVFHSFRHSSITYKLKLNGGDIKAVQGDSGHAQASMVTEQYAHILDDDRRLNAQRFDDFFYQHHGAEPEVLPRAEQSTPKASPVDTDAAAALAKLLADPSMATLIKNLAKNL